MSVDELFSWLLTNKLSPIAVNDSVITFNQGESTFGSIITEGDNFKLSYRTTLSHLPLYFSKMLSSTELISELTKFINFPKKD